ncbi:MAG: recombinase family protein [Lachnospiraceae bacterium]|nr:recombinase family protein [Lachnospiraceae bacterium]
MVIAIYARKSVYRDTSDSISNQVDMCRDFIERSYGTGHTILIYDQDEGISGATTKRPCFQKLMNDIKADMIDMVVCYMIDRISRNIKDFCNIYFTFQEHDCRFVSVKENIDDTTPMGRAMLYICQVFANLERDNIRERIIDNMTHIEQLGYWSSGLPPLGYKIEKIVQNGKKHSILAIDEAKSPIYLRMVELFTPVSATLSSVEKAMMAEGYRTDKGSIFDTSRIWKILSNPDYMCADENAYHYFAKMGCKMLHDIDRFDGTYAIMVRGRFRREGSRMLITDKSEWKIYVGFHKPLISSDDWIKIQERFQGNRYYRPSHRAIYGICSGFLFCKCGYTMRSKRQSYGKKNPTYYASYLCTRKDNRGRGYCDSHMVKCELIDEKVIRKLKELSVDQQTLSEYINKDKVVTSIDLKMMQKQNLDLSKQIQALTLSLSEANGSAARKYIIAEIERLDEEKNAITGKVTAYKVEQMRQEQEAVNILHLLDKIHYLLSHLDSLTIVEKNALLKEIVKKITVSDDTIEITF